MFSTFVINLDKDTERMQFMHEQLTRLNIDYRRESAVLGKTYNPAPEEYNEAEAVKKGGHALLPGEIGCALSHAHVIQKVVAEKIPYTLVLEDDVELPVNFSKILEREINNNSSGSTWEYLLFDYVIVGRTFIRQWFSGVAIHLKKTWQEQSIKVLPQALFFALKGLYIIPLSLFEGARDFYKKYSPGPVRFFRPVYFAGAYLVTYEGAKKLQALSRPVVYTADQLPNQARVLKNLRFRGYSPQSVHQLKQVFGSSILDLDGRELISNKPSDSN